MYCKALALDLLQNLSIRCIRALALDVLQGLSIRCIAKL